MTEDDDTLWKIMTEDVTPLEDRQIPLRKTTRPARTKKPQHVHVKSHNKAHELVHSSSPYHEKPPAPLDKNTASKLRKGQIKIEGRLDLHGMSLDQAHTRLTPFIMDAYYNKKRCVIVVTGKGLGILQRNVPLWLEQHPLKQVIMKTSRAHAKHGGDGALYVYLRKTL